MRNKFFVLFALLGLTNCSTYKSSWDCPLQEGIGCGTIEFADELAREQIKLNKVNAHKQNIFFNPDIFGNGA